MNFASLIPAKSKTRSVAEIVAPLEDIIDELAKAIDANDQVIDDCNTEILRQEAKRDAATAEIEKAGAIRSNIQNLLS